MIKKITLGITLFFSALMIASPAYADWEWVSRNIAGDTYYVDFDRIRTNGGYVYYWQLSDYLEPIGTGVLSAKVYRQGDCEMFRYKYLGTSYYKQPMGEGSGNTDSRPDTEWTYPSPNSAVETILKRVCEYAENL